MYLRSWGWLLAFLLPSGLLCAQKITGRVQDSLGNAVPFASVVLSGCSDGQVLGFIMTDDKGAYELSFTSNRDTALLTIRALGFQTAEKRIILRNPILECDFILSATTTTLREIVVRDKTPPIVVRGDTTEYNVASFSDSTEFNVEDVLRKLPGIRVSENGIITLNGKTVERVLIEGDDLFSDNYQIATRNIRANTIGKVQAIDRFQENPLLRGVQESDRLVLNLKIKDERKRANSGNLTAGSGYGADWKAYVHANLFSLARRDKIYLIGNFNNTGENAAADIEWVNRGSPSDRNSQGLQNSPLRIKDLILQPQLENTGLSMAFTQANRSGVLFLGYVLPLTPSFKIKLTGWLADGWAGQSGGSFSRYLLDNGPLNISETHQTHLRTGVRRLQAETEYFSRDQKHMLRFFGKISAVPNQFSNDWLRSLSLDETLHVAEALRQRAFETYAAAEYTFKTGEQAIFQFLVKYHDYTNKAMLEPQYAWYPLFFAIDSSFTSVQQRADQQCANLLLTARFVASKWSAQWLLEAGWQGQNGRIKTDLTLENSSGEQWRPPDDYQNDFRLHAPRYFANLGAARIFGPLFVHLQLHAHHSQLRSQAAPDESHNTRLGAMEPRFDARYTIGQYSTLTGFYAWRQESPEFTALCPAFLFTSYQTLERGLPDVSLQSRHRAGLQYRYNDQRKQFSWHLGGNADQIQNGFGTSFQINPFLFVQEKFRPAQTTRYTARAGASRYFPALNSRFDVDLSFLTTRSRDKINSTIPRILDSRIYSGLLAYGTAFDGWVNGILTNQVTHHVARNRQAQSNLALFATTWSSSLQIVVKPSRKFNLKIKVYRVANHIRKEPVSTYYAAESMCRFIFEKSRSELQFSALNLLNARQFEQVFADTFFQSTTSVTAVRPFFLLSWDFSF